MAEISCWEFKKCGKEKDCPAWPNNGRICFSIEKTLCRGEIQGQYLQKIDKCRETCDFYAHLMQN